MASLNKPKLWSIPSLLNSRLWNTLQKNKELYGLYVNSPGLSTCISENILA